MSSNSFLRFFDLFIGIEVKNFLRNHFELLFSLPTRSSLKLIVYLMSSGRIEVWVTLLISLIRHVWHSLFKDRAPSRAFSHFLLSSNWHTLNLVCNLPYQFLNLIICLFIHDVINWLSRKENIWGRCALMKRVDSISTRHGAGWVQKWVRGDRGLVLMSSFWWKNVNTLLVKLDILDAFRVL